MKTTLSPERLTRLHAETREPPAFVDPVLVTLVKRLLRERGEEWASSVLLRDLTRRARIDRRLPWLEHRELDILVRADEEEWKLLGGGAS